MGRNLICSHFSPSSLQYFMLQCDTYDIEILDQIVLFTSTFAQVSSNILKINQMFFQFTRPK